MLLGRELEVQFAEGDRKSKASLAVFCSVIKHAKISREFSREMQPSGKNFNFIIGLFRVASHLAFEGNLCAQPSCEILLIQMQVKLVFK